MQTFDDGVGDVGVDEMLQADHVDHTPLSYLVLGVALQLALQNERVALAIHTLDVLDVSEAVKLTVHHYSDLGAFKIKWISFWPRLFNADNRSRTYRALPLLPC